MIYELFTYIAEDGKMDDLHRRFEEATVDGFARAGIEAVAFFRNREDPSRLHYLVRFPDTAARDEAWANFKSDPQWLEAKAASEENGRLVADRSSIELELTHYSPPL